MIRLHLPAIPHTVTNDLFSHCAFTGKVLRFAPMMRSRGFEVYHYGVEGSTPDATKDIQLFTKNEWDIYRFLSYKKLHPELSGGQITEFLNDPKHFIGDLANYSTPLYEEFNVRLKSALKLHYRGTGTDIVCLPFGYAHQGAIGDLDVVAVETGIGYSDSYKSYRIFESYAWLHRSLQKYEVSHNHYWFVVPNYYNILEWPLNLKPKRKIGFFGRISYTKGLNIVVAVAQKFLDVEFVLCGQGDAAPYVSQSSNIVYKPPIHGEDRGEFLNELSALIAPSYYLEPFCGVNVEAQLCGTPVITNDFGAFTETIEPFKTGLLCHTLADFCKGIQMALDGEFDRQYIRNRATKLYDMYNVAKQYEYTFKTILDVSNGNSGWYSENTYIDLLDKSENIVS